MKERTRILRQRHEGDTGLFFLYITRQDEGTGGVYRSERTSGDQIAWGPLDTVKHITAERLTSEKHECGDLCSLWEPLSDAPTTHEEPPYGDDADVDRFITSFFTKLNPVLTADERADAIHDFVLGYIHLIEPDKSKEWFTELARKVRSRALLLPLDPPKSI